MGQKAKVRLLSAIQLPRHLLSASIVPINSSNDHSSLLKYRQKTAGTARAQVTPETTQVTHSSELHTNPRTYPNFLYLFEKLSLSRVLVVP